MQLKYLVSSFLSLALLVIAFLYFRNSLEYPYESSDDIAWECTLDGRKGHLLAERSDMHMYSKREALVQWEDGSRDWIAVSRLPHYKKISTVNPKKTALVSESCIDSVIIGKTFRELENGLACAGRVKGEEVVFPIKILRIDESVSTDSVAITFRDSVAVAVDYTMNPDKKSRIYSLVPGLFYFIDKGIKAPQREGYVSHLKGDENEAEKEYHFGDGTISVIKSLGALLLFLLVLALVTVTPLIVSGPVLLLYRDHLISDEIAIALGIVSELVCLYALTVVYIIFDGPGWVVPLISIAVCASLTVRYYINCN